MTDKKLATVQAIVEAMKPDELRWAAMMYGGKPNDGSKLTESQLLLIRLAHDRAVKMPELWQ